MITPLTEGQKTAFMEGGRHIILEGYIHRAIQTLIIEDANTNTDECEHERWWRREAMASG